MSVSSTESRSGIATARCHPTDRVTAVDPVDRERAVTAIRIFHARWDEPLDIVSVAHAACASRSAFVRSFTSTTGVAPGRFLACIRFDHAKRLLATTDLPVNEICRATGYVSVPTFVKQFAAYVGVTPARFRRVYARISCIPVDMALALTRSRHADASRGDAVRFRSPSDGLLFAGVFPDGAPLGAPTSGSVAVISEGVPAVVELAAERGGRVLAACDPGARFLGDLMLPGPRTLVGSAEIAEVVSTSVSVEADAVELRSLTVCDPPLVLALPVLVQP